MINKGFKVIDLFCGIGGFHQAMTSLGGECVFESDIDKYCQQTYFENYGIKPVGDVCKRQRMRVIRERHKGEVEHLIRAVGHNDLLRTHSVDLRHFGTQDGAFGITVQRQAVNFLRNRRLDGGRRRKR